MTTLAGKQNELNSDSFINKLIMSNRSLSDISLNKPPFLPKLPKKTIQCRKIETHLINDFYLEPDLSKSSNSLNKKLQIDFKGDLLKAKQIYLALNSNMSNTIKHVKTTDTIWMKENVKSAKPCRSTLIKNKIEPESFIRTPISRSNIPCRYSATNSSIHSKITEHIKSSSNLNKLLYELEKSPVEIKKFAEDLLNEHYTKSSIQKTDDTKPDIALHVFNSIWELHSYALENSSFLKQLMEYQLSLPPTSEIKLKIKESKEKTRTNIFKDRLDKMTNLLLEIQNPLIDKHSLAVAIGNLYHPDTIEVPSKLAPGVLAAAHLLKFDKLKTATISKMSVSLTKKNIGSYYQSCYKYHEKHGIEVCEKWLEMHLIPYLGSSIYLRDIPLRLLTKTIKSKKFFTVNEYDIFLTIIVWVFLNINREITEVPSESIIITYFSSLSKDVNLIERYPDLNELLYSVRLYGITKTNYLNTIQQMNIYPNSYIVQIMMEIQQSLNHGGDMALNRLFDTSALRQGFVLEIENSNYNDVFSIYGFHFELIAEKVSNAESLNHMFQFYIQRLGTNDPMLTYEKSQLETFSLRNDRFCNYSINVQYWYKGDQVFLSTGMKKQRFGKLKTQRTQVFTVEVPKSESQENSDQSPSELFILYSLIFPPN